MKGASGAAPTATPLTYAEITFVALVWGAGAVAIKASIEGFPPMTAAGLRLGLASLLYAPLLLLYRHTAPWPSRRDLPGLLWLAFIGYFIFNVFFFLALSRTTASHGVLVWGAQPVVTAVLAAALLGERVSGRAIAGVLISLSGVALIVASSLDPATAFGADTAGDLLLVAMMLAWVLYTIASRKMMARMSPLATTGYSCFLGFAMIAPVTLLAGFEPSQLTSAPAVSWAGIIFSGWVSMVLTYILWNRTLLRLGPTRTAVFINLSPVFGLGLAWALRGEAISWIHITGAALIIGGVLLANIRAARARPTALVAGAVSERAG